MSTDIETLGAELQFAQQASMLDWVYGAAALALVFQGVITAAFLQALASITESLRGIRISSKAAALAATGGNTAPATPVRNIR